MKAPREGMKRLGRPPGKLSDPAYQPVTAWVRKKTYQAVRERLLKESRKEFSVLVEECSGHGLGANGNDVPVSAGWRSSQYFHFANARKRSGHGPAPPRIAFRSSGAGGGWSPRGGFSGFLPAHREPFAMLMAGVNAA
jgi:hypothetical protein